MSSFDKKIWTLVGIFMPVFAVVLVLGIVYLPRLLLQPEYNFLYVANSYPVGPQYFVKDQGLLKIQEEYGHNSLWEVPKLYVYDTRNDKSKEVSYEEAMKFKLDSSNTAPDGYKIIRRKEGESGSRSIFSYERSVISHYIRGKGLFKRLKLQGQSRFFDLVYFVGWIKS